jgi:hypothetical protein
MNQSFFLFRSSASALFLPKNVLGSDILFSFGENGQKKEIKSFIFHRIDTKRLNERHKLTLYYNHQLIPENGGKSCKLQTSKSVSFSMRAL